MTQMVGNQLFIDSLRRDVKEIQESITGIISRIGPSTLKMRLN